LDADANISQANIVMTEDMTGIRQNNDYVFVGGQDVIGQGTTAWQQIQSISGTTITLTGNLLTNLRKAGGVVLNRDRGWGIKFLGYSNAVYFRCYIENATYLHISGTQFYDSAVFHATNDSNH